MTSNVFLGLRAIGVGTFVGGGALLAVTSTLGAFLLLSGTFALPLAIVVSMEERDADREAQRIADRTWSFLRDAFSKTQKDAFGAKQTELVRLADAELTADRLLDERTLAYLAVLPPDRLKKASDQLAISVLQARALLAYHRCHERYENGNKLANKPLSFGSLSLDPSLPVHRVMLREKLERADQGLREDSYSDYETLDVPKPLYKTNILGHLGRWFANPLFTAGDRQRLAPELPEIGAVKVKPLIAAEDFSAALRHYHKENEPLDLPAMNGWPERVSALPARKQNLHGSVRTLPRLVR